MKKLPTLIVAVLMVATASWAHAQVRATGQIEGTVVDSDGVPLPGVQVTATGPALMGEQVAFTGNDGGYRLTLLPPGDYTVTYQLQGFATVQRENIDVGIRRTASVDIQMQLAAVEQTITVTARTPLVDIKSTKASSAYSDELLNTLPETRGTGADLMALAPEASVPAGGNQTSSPSFFGSPTNSNSFQVDGVTVTDPGGGFQFPFYSPDWFQVVDLTVTGANAEYGKAMGSVFNVVTKSGGNSFHGESNFYFQNDAFIDSNTEELLPDLEPDEISHRVDFTANIGGPLIRDQLWFFAGYQVFNENFRPAGFASDITEDSDRFLGKLTWQVNQDNRLIFSNMNDTFSQGGRGAGIGNAATATSFEPSMNITPNVTWNHIISPDAFLEVKYSGFYGFFDLIPDFPDVPTVWDTSDFDMIGGYWGTYTFDRARTNVQGNVSYFAEDIAGDHSFKFGAEWERNLTDDNIAFVPATNPANNGIGIQYLAYLGDLYFAYTFEGGGNSRSTSLINVMTLYAQDDWTIADRVTLNLGLRFDQWDIGFKGASRDDEPTFEDVAPRAGINFDVTGDGRTSLHAFYGRFYEEAHGSAFSDFDPQQATLQGWFTTPDGVLDTLAFEDDPLEGFGIDPDLSNTYSDQVTAGIEHQLTEDLAVGAKYVRKRDRDIYAGRDIGSIFAPITVTSSLGATIDAFETVDASDRFILMTNDLFREPFRDYDGVQFKATKRLTDDWSLIASLMIQEATGNISNTSGGNLGSDSGFDTPNEFVNTPGELPNSRRYSFKAQGSYLLPNPIRTLLGFQLDAASSARFTITESFGELGALDRNIAIEEIGSRTSEAFVNLNLRAEKKFQLRGPWGDLGVVFDVFNLTNRDGIIDIVTGVSSFGEVDDIQNPRTYRLGFRWLF